eukprot:TRINITY_DN33418_c2_g1_i1.p1 TRINITY_DN33418_c2_g1~~TRINITY_DN33418_c2_g1_i1.p1  ORF type:complete len:153 (+),score=25.04 TRINITY_DN33418_c2_g1_i1:86-544(+)
MIPEHTSVEPIHPSNLPYPLTSDSPLSTLPSDVVFEILAKIPAPILDCSNPFSILENCSLADPTSSTSFSKNILASHKRKKRIVHDKVADLEDPTPPPLSDIPNLAQLGESSLVVDLSPFKMIVSRKSKGKGHPSLGPKTKSSSGPPSKSVI